MIKIPGFLFFCLECLISGNCLVPVSGKVHMSSIEPENKDEDYRVLSKDCTSKANPVMGGVDFVEYRSLPPGSPAVMGSRLHVKKYAGFEFHFSSHKNARAFEARPDYYAPAWGGFCSWGIAAEHFWRKDALGPNANRDTWAVVDDRLHLFMACNPFNRFFVGIGSGVGDEKLQGNVPKLLMSGNRIWANWFGPTPTFNTGCFVEPPIDDGPDCLLPPGTHFTSSRLVIKPTVPPPHTPTQSPSIQQSLQSPLPALKALSLLPTVSPSVSSYYLPTTHISSTLTQTPSWSYAPSSPLGAHTPTAPSTPPTIQLLISTLSPAASRVISEAPTSSNDPSISHALIVPTLAPEQFADTSLPTPPTSVPSEVSHSPFTEHATASSSMFPQTPLSLEEAREFDSDLESSPLNEAETTPLITHSSSASVIRWRFSTLAAMAMLVAVIVPIIFYWRRSTCGTECHVSRVRQLQGFSPVSGVEDQTDDDSDRGDSDNEDDPGSAVEEIGTLQLQTQ